MLPLVISERSRSQWAVASRGARTYADTPRCIWRVLAERRAGKAECPAQKIDAKLAVRKVRFDEVFHRQPPIVAHIRSIGTCLWVEHQRAKDTHQVSTQVLRFGFIDMLDTILECLNGMDQNAPAVRMPRQFLDCGVNRRLHTGLGCRG